MLLDAGTEVCTRHAAYSARPLGTSSPACPQAAAARISRPTCQQPLMLRRALRGCARLDGQAREHRRCRQCMLQPLQLGRCSHAPTAAAAAVPWLAVRTARTPRAATHENSVQSRSCACAASQVRCSGSEWLLCELCGRWIAHARPSLFEASQLSLTIPCSLKRSGTVLQALTEEHSAKRRRAHSKLPSLGEQGLLLLRRQRSQ